MIEITIVKYEYPYRDVWTALEINSPLELFDSITKEYYSMLELDESPRRYRIYINGEYLMDIVDFIEKAKLEIKL